MGNRGFALGLDSLSWELAGAGIAVGLALLLLAKFKTTAGAAATTTFNSSIDAAITGIGGIPDWFGIVVLMLIGVFLLGMWQGRRN